MVVAFPITFLLLVGRPTFPTRLPWSTGRPAMFVVTDSRLIVVTRLVRMRMVSIPLAAITPLTDDMITMPDGYGSEFDHVFELHLAIEARGELRLRFLPQWAHAGGAIANTLFRHHADRIEHEVAERLRSWRNDRRDAET
jgi:hypothetical protein